MATNKAAHEVAGLLLGEMSTESAPAAPSYSERVNQWDAVVDSPDMFARIKDFHKPFQQRKKEAHERFTAEWQAAQQPQAAAAPAEAQTPLGDKTPEELERLRELGELAEAEARRRYVNGDEEVPDLDLTGLEDIDYAEDDV